MENKMAINYSILYHLQDIFNLLPDISLTDMAKSKYINTNDQMLVLYIASMVRSILALHDLINNKLTNREKENSEEMDQKVDHDVV